MYKYMAKVVIEILQGSALTLTTLGGLTIYPPVANFLQYICAKNYENWLAVDKVIAKIIRLTFFWPTLYSACHVTVQLLELIGVVYHTYVSQHLTDVQVSDDSISGFQF